MRTTRSLVVGGGLALALIACGGGNASNDAGADAGPPAGWTCDPDGFSDGFICHCDCGIPDPDCATPDLIVSGCTNDEICAPDGTCTNCGNGVLDTEDDEVCDTASSATTECAPLGYQPGQVPCKAGCEWAYDQCEPLVTCANGQLDAGELCDGNDIQVGLDCSDYGRTSGSLACMAGCAINSSDCHTCGDGNVEGPEACDDFGTSNDNGCSNNCAIEGGWTCAGEPSQCTPICGDGLIIGNETCDDGDAFGNDGCSATCRTEADCTCGGTPSTCSCATVQVIATQTNYVYFDTASLVLDANGLPHVTWVYGIDFTDPVTNFLREHVHVMYATKPGAAWMSTEFATWDQTRTTIEADEFDLSNDGGVLRQFVHRLYNTAGTFGAGTLAGSAWTFAYGNPYYIYDATHGGNAWHMLVAGSGSGDYRYQAGAPGALTLDEPVTGIFNGNELNIERATNGDVFIASLLPNAGRTSYSMKVSRRTGVSTWGTVYDVTTTGACVYPVLHLPLALPGGGMMFFEDSLDGTSRSLKAHRQTGPTTWAVETVADLSSIGATCSAGAVSYTYAFPVAAVDQLGQPHILVRGPTTGVQTWTTVIDHYRTASGWQTRSFPLTRGRPIDMIIDANGTTHIVAAAANGADFGNSRLVYLRIDADAWN